MNILLSFLIGILPVAHAHSEHDHHAQEIKAEAPLPGSSVFHLDSEWTNSENKKIKLSELGGKPSLVAMLFTQCETACPLLVEDLKEIAGKLPQNKFEVFIFSIDSVRDTPQKLKEFGVKRKIPREWKVMTTNAGNVAELAAVLGVRYKKLPNGDFIHSNLITFLDEKGTLVARKEGLKTPHKEFVKQIRKEIESNRKR